MIIYEFKVWMEDYPEVIRKIAIGENQTFEDLYGIVLDSVNFDQSQLASFYICNDNWDKKIEISLIDMNADEGEMIALMSETVIGEYLTRKDQKVAFEYDFVLMWKFLLEVTAIKKDVDTRIVPEILESEGTAPDQYNTLNRYPDELNDDENKYVEQLLRVNADKFLNEDDFDDDLEDDDTDPNDPFKDFDDFSNDNNFDSKEDY